ncbi:MAG: tagaturonate reductase [Planctomycetota bacterium]
MAKPLPETILQFGGGRFLRSFFDRFVHDANEAGQEIGRVVVVQSTPGSRASLLNARPEGYPLLVRGIENGAVVDRVDRIGSVSRGLEAATQWDQVLELARAPQLKFIVSNTTEAGYALTPDDRLDGNPPVSFPAKLARVLWERFQAKGSPLMILPCELFERNANRLRELVVTLAGEWKLPVEFVAWLDTDCIWLNNLVDCIVTAPPPDHPMIASEPLLNVREPFALLAVEKPAGKTVSFLQHPDIHLVDDVGPYHLRKVRMLNGTHTAMVAKFKPAGFETVIQVMSDPAASRWVRDLLYEEIVPTLAYRSEGVALFADQTWDRFRNPFLNHRLADIAAHHADKVKIRLLPTIEEYTKLFGKAPQRLSEAVAVGTP